MTANSSAASRMTNNSLSASNAMYTVSAMKHKTICQKFCPNVFTPNKCQDCYMQKNAHSQEALAENRACRKICKCGYLFVAAADVDFTNPSHRTRRWQRRWFVLYDDGDLTFSLDEQADTVPQAVLDMHAVIDVADGRQITGQDFSIILTTDSREYYVKGSSKEEIRRWFDLLVMYPRSAHYTRRQRSQNQKLRSRTLPSNSLSDEQLMALKVSSLKPPDLLTCSVTPATSAKTSEFFGEMPYHKVLPVHGIESIGPALLSLISKRDGANETDIPAILALITSDSNLAKETANKSVKGPVDAVLSDVNANRQPPLYEYHSYTGTFPPQSLATANNVEATKPVIVRNLKTWDRDKIVPNSLFKSSTMDHLDQLKEKRTSNGRSNTITLLPCRNTTDTRASDKYIHHNKVVQGGGHQKEHLASASSEQGADSYTSYTDSSSEADEGQLECPQSMPSISWTSSSGDDVQKRQRLVFTGLSPKDMDDLKQLEKIMSRKGGTGSTSSRSSSNSSAYGSLHPIPLMPADPPARLTDKLSSTAPLPSCHKSPASEVDFHTRPRSPPLNRTAMSRVKERARVRSRSKSPITRERSPTVPSKQSEQKNTLVTNGQIKYEESVEKSSISPGAKCSEIKDRLQHLRKAYLPDIQRNPHPQRHSDASLPANFQSNLISTALLRSSIDQSTQISLDVRHYETMVSNLEKRLIDREQFIREASNKMSALTTSVAEKDRQISVLEKSFSQSQKDIAFLTNSLKKSESLNDDYQKRLEHVTDLWTQNAAKEFEGGKTGLRDSSNAQHGGTEMKRLQEQLKDLEESYESMAIKKDNVINASRREVERLSEKLAERQCLFFSPVNREHDAIIPTHSVSDATDMEEFSRKLLYALSEVKAIRLDKSNLEKELNAAHVEILAVKKDLTSRDSDYTALQARYEQVICEMSHLRTQNLRYEDEIVVMKSQVVKEPVYVAKPVTGDTGRMHMDSATLAEESIHEHESCHATIDALHAEIQSLQKRLQKQKERHASLMASNQECSLQRAKTLQESLSGLQEFAPEAHERGNPQQKVPDMPTDKRLAALTACHADMIKDMQAIHQQEMTALSDGKDQELMEEAKATRVVIEAIQRAYRENLKAEVDKVTATYQDILNHRQRKMYENVQEQINTLTLKMPSSAVGRIVSLNTKEDYLYSYHDHLMEISRQCANVIHRPVESHTSAVFVCRSRGKEKESTQLKQRDGIQPEESSSSCESAVENEPTSD